ncbi:putative protein phosphatase 2C-like protein 44 [Macadamia integrifolia]|uniref:putative protein phosphatase 2C-like protein 44 n=1 Tax=Macadamia integrifolia TaxID=60698 RepID=UPI001C4EE3FA|nr:putative protein phosphatase 2C-like protein 44 [Macadamia integrifolia]
MGLKDLQHKFKASAVTRFLTGNGERSKRNGSKKCSWITTITHGFHVIDDKSLRGRSGYSDSDSVLVQREQIQDQEGWIFGVFDAKMGDGVTGYLQSHLFDKNLNESQIRKKSSKETMKKAFLSTREKSPEAEQENERTRKMGSTYAIVINGEKVVAAYMGDYRAVLCRDGVANLVGKRHLRSTKRLWRLKLLPGTLHMPKVRILVNETGNAVLPSTSRPVIGVEKLDSEAEFLILASNGIWEVMNNQEAVNLIRHIDDPEEAARCLTMEASTRMSRSNISCLVIRFD